MARPDVFYVVTEETLSGLNEMRGQVPALIRPKYDKLIDAAMSGMLKLRQVPGDMPSCMEPDGAKPCAAYAKAHAAAALHSRMIDALEEQVRNPEDICAISAYLLEAEKAGQWMGGYSATQAVEALCRMINVPPDELRRAIELQPMENADD